MNVKTAIFFSLTLLFWSCSALIAQQTEAGEEVSVLTTGAEPRLDTLLLLNSKIIIAQVTDTTDKADIKYAGMNKKKEQVVYAIERERVFSIKYSNGKEVIIYAPDSTNEDEFSVQDMRLYIEGEQDAYNYFKSKGSFYGGLATGLIGAYVTSPLLIVSPLVPGVYTAINGSRWVKLKKMRGANPSKLEHDTYLMGYSRVARNKRIQSALAGAGIGLVAGVTTMIIFKDNIPTIFDLGK